MAGGDAGENAGLHRSARLHQRRPRARGCGPHSAAPRPAPSYAAAESYAIGKGSGAITLADLNGDGKPDLASLHSNTSTVTVLLNRAGGRFATRATYDTAAHPWGWKPLT